MDHQNIDQFNSRHIGPSAGDNQAMLAKLGFQSTPDLIDKVIPASLKRATDYNLPDAATETAALAEIKELANKNELFSDFIGCGYYGTITPSVIKRNILENPGWYTQYTPYQAEIAQGRLEALLNFQTAICSLTGMDIANGSLLDEGTAAAEAVSLAYGLQGKNPKNKILVSNKCHPQTLAVIQTRAQTIGIEVELAEDLTAADFSESFGVVVSYPDTYGQVSDYSELFAKVHAAGGRNICIADPLALACLKTPASMGADIAVGTTQRLGVPMGFGGPHAAYFATKDEFKRKVPGRIVGISKDSQGRTALRLALQTREQHIRRDKATSNICTSQVLLAIMSSMYCVYHGPDNIKKISESLCAEAEALREAAKAAGYQTLAGEHFDTIVLKTDKSTQEQIRQRALSSRVNLRYFENGWVGITISEATNDQDFSQLAIALDLKSNTLNTKSAAAAQILGKLYRTEKLLTEEVFNSFHTEAELTRYIKSLERKDLSLTHSMIPLGSCTMKLNAVSELYPVSWPEFANMHPFAPAEQTKGYQQLLRNLEDWLSAITGFACTSLQPNSGAQGEYAGLLAITGYLQANNQQNRDICLIPTSAHGTNPASAVMAGLKVVAVTCDNEGNINLEDLHKKLAKHRDNLACLMITYPSTHGVFEESISEICDAIHEAGGLVYMDGANMNAQVGLIKPGEFGADVCHLNLHKTFCIPHGGGGPGVGPIAAIAKLKPYLPGHPADSDLATKKIGPVSAAPYGSAGILAISWMYIRMMGNDGLKKATETAILNANYLAKRLSDHFPVLYTGRNGLVAHECIIDLRPLKKTTGVDVEDIAKRLIDYGFHAPTMAWPVAGTLMIEPTESESKAEIDRFCDAMISIHGEIAAIESGTADKANNCLKNAPHTAEDVVSDSWDHPYSRNEAAFPLAFVKANKFWPATSRIDNAYGDRNLVCACGSVAEYTVS